MKKKLLICGSAGFLMSNLIRYLLYRTKITFDIVSVDKLTGNNDIRKLYINPQNKFYIGNICDEEFIDKILYLETPDIIINGTSYKNCNTLNFDKIIKGTTNLIRAKAPLIQICGYTGKNYDYLGFWNFIKNIVVEDGGTTIEIPNMFGIRQSAVNSVPNIIKKIISNGQIEVENSKISWSYSEDLASLIWFIIENNLKGSLCMPELGKISEFEIAEFVSNMYKLNLNIKSVNWVGYLNNMISNYKFEGINGWKSDYSNIYEALEKTVKWYDANRWAIT